MRVAGWRNADGGGGSLAGLLPAQFCEFCGRLASPGNPHIRHGPLTKLESPAWDPLTLIPALPRGNHPKQNRVSPKMQASQTTIPPSTKWSDSHPPQQALLRPPHGIHSPPRHADPAPRDSDRYRHGSAARHPRSAPRPGQRRSAKAAVPALSRVELGSTSTGTPAPSFDNRNMSLDRAIRVTPRV